MKIAIEHVMQWAVAGPIRHSTQYLRLKPHDTTRQRVLSWQIESQGHLTESRDGFGNVLHVLSIDQPLDEVTVRAFGIVETGAIAEDRRDGVRLSPLVFLRPTLLTGIDAPLAEFAEGYRRRAGTLSGLRELAGAVARTMAPLPDAYLQRPAAQAFAAGAGTCEDHAHVFIAACRHLGVPARYVSGYVYTDQPQQLVTHAWAEAWVVDRWRSFDVTNDRSASEDHIRVALGADYLDACPVRAMRRAAGTERTSARVAHAEATVSVQ